MLGTRTITGSKSVSVFRSISHFVFVGGPIYCAIRLAVGCGVNKRRRPWQVPGVCCWMTSVGELQTISKSTFVLASVASTRRL